MKMNEDTLAIEMYMTTAKLAKEIGFIRYQIYPQLQIGDIYLKNQEEEKAFEAYIRALRAASENRYSKGIDQAIERIRNTFRKD